MIEEKASPYDLRKCNQRRLLRGWSQQQIADKTRLHQTAVSHFFVGRPVGAPTAKKIVTALGLKMEDVLLPTGKQRKAS